MRTIERSTQFKKDYKKYFKSVYGSELDARLKEVIGHLLAEQPWASPVFVDSCLGSLLINNTAF